jgi:acetamidase/formamidase
VVIGARVVVRGRGVRKAYGQAQVSWPRSTQSVRPGPGFMAEEYAKRTARPWVRNSEFLSLRDFRCAGVTIRLPADTAGVLFSGSMQRENG